MTNTNRLIQPLAQGPLDIIGDIHGEIDALSVLLERLGYRADGSHPDNRHLVFVGDLCDRGPDSPAVIFKVRDLVESGRAQCVLGNHELNLLRREQKTGNHWFIKKENHDEQTHEFGTQAFVAPHQEEEILAFFNALPLALERSDLRVVHAAWDNTAINRIRGSALSVLELYKAFEQKINASVEGRLMKQEAEREKALYEKALTEATSQESFTPFLYKHAQWEAHFQCENPVRVLTSGLEKIASQSFRTHGTWRFVERVPWWHDYTDTPVVIFGHYWRFWNPAARSTLTKGEPDLFEGDHPEGWQTNKHKRQVAFCIDYSVGARYLERKLQSDGPFHGRLAALRWPEGELVFDHL
jgi:hypothetical protein